MPAPKACLPFGGEAGGWPGLGDPEEELDVDAMDFDFGGDLCCRDQDARRRRGPGRTSGRAVHRGGRRPGAGAIWGMAPRHSKSF